MSSAIKNYPMGAEIFQAGDLADAAYILIQGTVEISVEEGKKKVILSTLKPVSVFGEMALLSADQRRTATARALELCKAAVITKNDFTQYLESSPKFITAALKALVDRLRETSAKLTAHGDTFLSICEVLYLLNQHDNLKLNLDFVTVRLARAFHQENEEVRQILQKMEDFGLIALMIERDRQIITIPRPVDFLERAQKIFDALHDFSR